MMRKSTCYFKGVSIDKVCIQTRFAPVEGGLHRKAELKIEGSICRFVERVFYKLFEGTFYKKPEQLGRESLSPIID